MRRSRSPKASRCSVGGVTVHPRLASNWYVNAFPKSDQQVSKAITMTTIAQVICAGCGKSDPAQRKSNRLPSRWKRIGEQTYCSVCIRQRLVLRAIIIRVAAIKDGTWEDFNDAMYKMWTQTTACSNWMMSQLYLRDVRRENGQTKLPAMPKIYLYPEARGLYPDLPSTSVAAHQQTLERH